jgi:hypothetical protein
LKLLKITVIIIQIHIFVRICAKVKFVLESKHCHEIDYTL